MTDFPSVDAVYKIFRQLNRIPRPSHSEDRVVLFLTRFAEKLGLEYVKDGLNNVLIRKQASPGHEQADTIVILNHMDMVCVAKEGVSFDPLHDSIQPVVEDGWMRAKGTSLGADNGIGLSMALALLQDNTLVHGPLEVLVTANEEDGMSGARSLSPSLLRGRKVINLDSEDYDNITVESAAARIQEFGMRARRLKTPLGSLFYDVVVEGGKGGHSGVDIDKNRANAILVLAATLTSMNKKTQTWFCHSFEGGNAAASIASSAKASVVLPEGTDIKKWKLLVTKSFDKAASSFRKTDPDLKVSVLKGKPVDDLVAPEDTIAFLDTIQAIPDGCLKIREDGSNVVQTSSNLGVVSQKQEYFDIFVHSRSFSDRQLDGLCQRIAHVFKEKDAAMKVLSDAPAWQQDASTPFLQTVDRTFQDVLGFCPAKASKHFVLEAGYLLQTFPGLEIASIGPRILEPHSPFERVELSTVEDIWKVTIELLARLAG